MISKGSNVRVVCTVTSGALTGCTNKNSCCCFCNVEDCGSRCLNNYKKCGVSERIRDVFVSSGGRPVEKRVLV